MTLSHVFSDPEMWKEMGFECPRYSHDQWVHNEIFYKVQAQTCLYQFTDSLEVGLVVAALEKKKSCNFSQHTQLKLTIEHMDSSFRMFLWLCKYSNKLYGFDKVGKS